MAAALTPSSQHSSLQASPSVLNIYHFLIKSSVSFWLGLHTQFVPSHISPTDNPFQLPHVPHVSQPYLSPTGYLQSPAEGLGFCRIPRLVNSALLPCNMFQCPLQALAGAAASSPTERCRYHREAISHFYSTYPLTLHPNPKTVCTYIASGCSTPSPLAPTP